MQYYPKIENQDVKLRELCEKELKEKYSDAEKLKERLDYELKIINLTNTESIFLYLNQAFTDLNIKPSQFMARGLIGNSLVAYLCGITNIDPLKFNLSEYLAFGVENCYKEPDIDINLNLNPKIDLLNAIVIKLESYDGIYKVVPASYKLSNGNIRKMHGHYYVIPRIDNYTQDDYDEIIKKIEKTDFHEINEYYRLDLLGVSQIPIICDLANLTNTNPESIDIDDVSITNYLKTENYKELFKYLTSIQNEIIMDIANTVKPKSFNDLLKVISLSRGIDVWTNNGELLIKEGKGTLNDIITSRADLFEILTSHGVDKKEAFHIVEDVRKGKGISKSSENYNYDYLLKCGLPECFIESCNKIKYLFAKSHAISNALLYWKIMWYKIHYGKEFEEVIVDYYDVNK